jgi:hypothetical protein
MWVVGLRAMCVGGVYMGWVLCGSAVGVFVVRIGVLRACVRAPQCVRVRVRGAAGREARVSFAKIRDPQGVTVPIGLRAKFEGGTQEQYDAIHGRMNVDADPPQGMIFHMAGPVDGGWGVIDVWESRDAFDQFFASRLQPAIQELGDRTFQSPPDIREFPVHHFTKP